MNHPTDRFVHPHGLCESPNVGTGTRIAAFTHVLAGAVLGADCTIGDHVFIDNDVHLGDRVRVGCGVQLWSGMELGDDVVIGPNATFSNDAVPGRAPATADRIATRVQRGASVGANATVLAGAVIGTNGVVCAGAVVTRTVPPNAIVRGNPARIVGYVGANDRPDAGTPAQVGGHATAPASARVRGVRLQRMTRAVDLRGSLSAGQVGSEIPFVVNRYFLVYGVPTVETRGEHAHRQCHQFLVAANGTVHVVADDGAERQEFVLDRPDMGLYLPPMTWGIQYRYSADAVLLVLASDPYDASDYIRDYAEFTALVQGQGQGQGQH